MTDHPDQPDDAFEQLARRAGAALRRPAPEDGVARLEAARRRQRIVRSSIAAGASAILVIVGLIIVTLSNRRLGFSIRISRHGGGGLVDHVVNIDNDNDKCGGLAELGVHLVGSRGPGAEWGSRADRHG